MSDEAVKKRDWAVPFVARLCVVGWVCAILYETFDFFKPIRQPCLLFGFWSSVLALLNAVALLFIRRQGIFFVFMLISIPPTVHFGMVMRNIAIQKKLIDAADFGGSTAVESKDQEAAAKQNTAPEEVTP